MVERRATRTNPYAYTLAGLPNVRLAGIRVRRCRKCGAEMPEIPRIQDLHRVIANLIVKKPGLLTGPEIRYLRKQAGFAAKQFAALIAIDPSTLSRVEAGKQKLSKAPDRLARAVSVAVGDGEAARDVLLNVAEQLHAHNRKLKQGSGELDLFTLNQRTWSASRAA